MNTITTDPKPSIVIFTNFDGECRAAEKQLKQSYRVHAFNNRKKFLRSVDRLQDETKFVLIIVSASYRNQIPLALAAKYFGKVVISRMVTKKSCRRLRKIFDRATHAPANLEKRFFKPMRRHTGTFQGCYL